MKNSVPMMTLSEIEVTEKDLSLENYLYQKELTDKLEGYTGDFTQEIINEIVLWKVSRYVEMPEETKNLLNKITKNVKTFEEDQMKDILRSMLSVKGIRLPMASTILRFKNPHIYQIIDQRAYRLLIGDDLQTKFRNVEEQITYYFDYLIQLKRQCDLKNIPFEKADMILYQLDKEYNRKYKIKM